KIAASWLLVVALLGGGGVIGWAQHRTGEVGRAAAQSSAAPAEPAAPSPLEPHWANLRSDDDAKALRALLALTRTPPGAGALFRQPLKPVTGEPQQMAKWLAGLDHRAFAVRQRAAEELENRGEYSLPYLAKVLDSKPPLEVRQRAEQIRDRITNR